MAGSKPAEGQNRIARQRRIRQRVMRSMLAVVAVGAGVTVYDAQATARRELPLYLSSRLSKALKRPVSVGKVSFWPLGAFSAKTIRIEGEPGDPQPLMTAARARIYLSWWDLIIHRRISVRELHVDRPHLRTEVDMREPKADRPDPTTQLLALHQTGLRRLGLHEAAVDVTTIQEDGSRLPMSAHGLDVVADLRKDHFKFQAGANQWSGVGLTAQNLALAGRADQNGVTLTQSRARFNGGELAARGTYATDGGDVLMQVDVTRLPVADLAQQLGIPPRWGVRGDLTGSMQISAGSGALRSAKGRLTVAPGSIARSQATFPWTTATALVDWKPDAVTLSDIDVQGNGIRLTGKANVKGKESLPFTQRPFVADGTLEATRAEAVADLARLAAFSTPVRGRWDVERATVTFDAKGTVGELQDARANGHLRVHGLMVRPKEGGNPLVVRTLDADLDRRADHLHLQNIRAEAEGLTARGKLTVTPGKGTAPLALAANGQVDLVSLALLRQQLPEASFWQWINPASPASRGRVTFNVQGPGTRPERMTGTGAFRFSEFSTNVPNGKGQAPWVAPVREFTGQMRLQGDRLALSDLRLRSDLLSATGRAGVANVSRGGSFNGVFRLVSDKWRQVPLLRDRVPAALAGGNLVLELQVPGSVGEKGAALAGDLWLRGARYQSTVGGKTRSLQVRDATATFRHYGDRIVLPAYRLVTPQFHTTGSGHALAKSTGADGQTDWQLHGTGVVTASDAGALARWWTADAPISGGNMRARYTVNGPADDPRRLDLSARLRLTDAQPRLASTLPFQAQDAKIRVLTGDFTMRNGVVGFQNAVWRAPRFQATGNGTWDGRNVNAAFRLSTPHWRPIAGDLTRVLPISGGNLSIAGRLNGAARDLRMIPLEGSLLLRGARLESDRNASLPLEGGAVDIRAEVRGPLSRLAQSDFSGSFSARDVPLPALRPGAKRVQVETARGRFHRSGTTITLTDLVAEAPGARLTGKGELRGIATGAASHSLDLGVEGPALASLLPALAPLPGKASGGKFSGSLEVRGTAAVPITQMVGRAEVRNAEWTPPGQGTAMKIARMTGRFVRRGGTATLDNAEITTDSGHATLTGTFSGLGTRTAPRHDLRLSWRLEDASAWATRFLPVPGWFTGGLFTGDARITGAAGRVAETASGKFEVRDAGFMPPRRFLGGPDKPIAVQWARGIFSRANAKTTIKDLDLKTSVGTATGTVVSDDRGIADLDARVDVARLEALVDLWPTFDGRLKGGRGEITLSLNGPLRQPRDLKGRVDIVGRGGALTVENVDELYGVHPFDEFSTRLRLAGGGKVRLETVKLRGPKANLDGVGWVTADGKVHGEGKAWFTEQFTRKLVKPKFLWPVAKLVGLKRIKSDFELDGSLNEARLDMGITRSMLWKLVIKKRVPETLRKLATGEAPLWSGDAQPEKKHIATRKRTPAQKRAAAQKRQAPAVSRR